jgi:hypothetical protein
MLCYSNRRCLAVQSLEPCLILKYMKLILAMMCLWAFITRYTRMYSSSMAQRLVHSACDRRSKATFVKISHQMGDQYLLSRVLPCFSRHVKLLHLQSLAPTPVLRRVDVRQAAVVKIIAEYLSQHDEKHVPAPLSGIRVGEIT